MDDILAIISKTNQCMTEYILQGLKKNGINDLVVSHGAILIYLMKNGEMNFKELSNKIGKSPQTMTTLIQKLEKHNYVTFKRSDNDKRNKIVSLTTKGEEFIPIMMDISQEMYKQQYAGFTQNEQETLRSLLNRVISNFNHEGDY